MAQGISGSTGNIIGDITGIVANPNKTRLPSNTDNQLITLGQQGDLVVSQVRGQFATFTVNSGLFIATSSTAAIAIPINTTTVGTTFGLYNPPTSGVLAEVVDFQLNELLGGPAAVNTVGWSAVNTATNAISAQASTGLNVWSGRLGSAATPACTALGAATFASALTVALNWLRGMFSFPLSATAGLSGGNLLWVAEGELIVPPGWAITLTATTAWAANSVIPSLSWIEYPV